MYKHQVIGARRAESWRSRQSEHIVGVCTLEAIGQNGRFVALAPKEDWQAVAGEVMVNGSKAPELTPKCRYWSLEEVVEAMSSPAPAHEFYTRHPKLGKTSVYSFKGRNQPDLYTKDPLGNLIPFNIPKKLYVKVAGKPKEMKCGCGVRWISTSPSDPTDNLDSLPATVIPCPMHDCPVIPTGALSVSRGDVPDC